MKQKTSKLINKKGTLLFLAAFLCLFDGSHANASDILEQANQAYELKNYGKAKDLYSQAAENGDAIAQHYLGNIYRNGQGIYQDYSKARYWYLKAAEQGYAEAQYSLGVMFDKGLGGEQNILKAKEWFLKAAKQGNKKAQFNIGTMYYHGDSFPVDYKKAKYWYQRAAEQGLEKAYFMLGVFHHNGHGVIKNFSKAKEFYLMAAELGDSDAQYNLGLMYHNGNGVSQDIKKAMEFYLMAAAQGDADAQYNLGYIYDKGDGGNLDKAKAKEWHLKAAKQNHKLAIHSLFWDEMNKENISFETVEKLKGFLSDKYFQRPITEETIYENSNLERIYLLTHIVDEEWQKKIKKVDEDFKFKKSIALERLAKLSQYPSGLALLDFLTNSFYLYDYVNKEEFEPIIDNLILNQESLDLELKINSANFLGKYFINGVLEPVDKENAEKYLKIAADLGSQFAQFKIGDYYLDEGRLDEAIHYLNLSSQNEDFMHFQIHSFNNLAIAQTVNGENIKTIIQNFKKSSDLALKSSYDYFYPSENLVRIYLSEKFGVDKNFEETEKYAKRMKSEGAGGILYEAYLAMKKNDKLKLIDFLDNYKNPSTTAFEKANYYFGLDEKEAFKNLVICRNISLNSAERYNCENMSKFMKAKMPGELADFLTNEAMKTQKELLLASGNNLSKENNIKTGNNYALFIANSNYENLNNLSTPKRDTKILAEILRYNYGYNIELISNASRREILKSLNKFKNKLETNDNLIVYYAGHGKSEGNTSFWLPREALPDDDTDWIEDSTIERKIGQIKAKNILVIADSCFSGNLTRGVNVVSVDINDEVIKTYKNTVSRVAITSGGDEPILDKGPSGHSVFAAALIDYLKSQTNGFTAQKLSKDIYERVLKTSIGLGMKQTPSYGELYNAGHQGPDFVFIPEK